MADCPDVHPDSDGELTAVRGSVVIAEGSAPRANGALPFRS
jgi:hypothetical protein